MVIEPDAIWTLPAATALLWALGGSGVLAIRRFGTPLIICVYLYLFRQTPLWLLGVQAIATYIVSTASYGRRVKDALQYFYWPYLYFIGALYGLGQFPIAVYAHNLGSYCIGIVGCSVVFGTLTWMSQKTPKLPWKIVEMAIGAMIGVQVVLIVQ